MKKINEYILERFKITKDIQGENHLLKDGETFVKIVFKCLDENSSVHLDVNTPYRLVKIEDEKLYYIEIENNNNVENFWPLKKKFYINKNGFYQLDYNDNKIFFIIFLNKDDGIEYIKEILRQERKNLDKKLLDIFELPKDKNLDKALICLQNEKALKSFIELLDK